MYIFEVNCDHMYSRIKIVKIMIISRRFQIVVPHTCGICETIIHEKSIPTYGCVEAYTWLFIDENFYFYPVTGIIFISIYLLNFHVLLLKRIVLY